jgi:hypothetical protein
LGALRPRKSPGLIEQNMGKNSTRRQAIELPSSKEGAKAEPTFGKGKREERRGILKARRLDHDVTSKPRKGP